MPWFVPIASLAGSVVVRRVVAGGVIYLAGTEVIGRLDDSIDGNIEDFEKELKDIGASVVGDIGNATLDVVRGIGKATVDGVDAAYDAIREKFVKGREPDIVAGFTIAMLAILTGVYVWHSVKNARDAL